MTEFLNYSHFSCLQEFEIDKKLKITGPADVAKIGIKAYNDECRAIVQRYSSEWMVGSLK